jgi:single-strand DNA-binding protein
MTLTGYVGHSLELKQTKTGVPTVSFRVGTTPRMRTLEGWVNGVTTWTTVVCYRNLAENIFMSIHKGDPVVVHGRIRTQSWVGPNEQTQERMVVEARFVGHDLNRGSTTFEKAVRQTEVVSEGVPEIPAPDTDDPIDDSPIEEFDLEEVLVS